MLDIHPSFLLEVPAYPAPRRRQESGLAALHPLILALCRTTRHFPGGDPLELGAGLRGAAMAAAEAVLAARELRGKPLGAAAALAEAARRLREVACCLEIARRLGYFEEARCAELHALHDRAWQGLGAMAAVARSRLRLA